ncbi:MAG TPA: AraC family transcriptional regulator [Gemmatimonadales bacterium]|nr:AraC family transcriptional regulator [Gemmatimonadales bacterium]
MRPVELVLFASPDVRVGTFRCPVTHPDFRSAGAIEGYSVAFPRTAVWIQHQGEKPFIADPLLATVYNKGQPYVRLPLAPDGDRVDWFSVSQPLAAAIAAEIDPVSTDDPSRPFRTAFAPCDPALYRRQRLLLHRVRQGGLSPLAIEREVVLLIAATLRAGVPRARRPEPVHPRAQRTLAEDARAVLAADPATTPGLRELATRLEVSPYHLCRVFRRWNGMTLHEYLIDFRVRAALEDLVEIPRDLSRLAHRLGFSSHSHFTAAFRRRMGAPPSRIRADLLAATAQFPDSPDRRIA